MALPCEASQSHLDTPQSVGLVWTSDRADTETSTWQHTTLIPDKHSCQGGIRTHNPSQRAAADPRLRPGGRILNTQSKMKCLLLRHNTRNKTIISLSVYACTSSPCSKISLNPQLQGHRPGMTASTLVVNLLEPEFYI